MTSSVRILSISLLCCLAISPRGIESRPQDDPETNEALANTQNEALETDLGHKENNGNAEYYFAAKKGTNEVSLELV